jgi:hypothetical protein
VTLASFGTIGVERSRPEPASFFRKSKMSFKQVSTRVLTLALASSLSFAGMMHSAQAAVIGTAELAPAVTEGVSLRSADSARSLLNDSLQRADVVAALQARGVDIEQAQARVAALSDSDAQWMAQQIDDAPAGAGDIIGTIVFIFVLLLLTDILGFTKIFPFTRSIR